MWESRISCAKEEMFRRMGMECLQSRNGIIPAPLLSDASITSFAVRVYAAISWFQAVGERRPPPTLRNLATFLHASPDGVYQAVKSLRRSGWCAVTKRGRESAYELRDTARAYLRGVGREHHSFQTPEHTGKVQGRVRQGLRGRTDGGYVSQVR